MAKARPHYSNIFDACKAGDVPALFWFVKHGGIDLHVTDESGKTLTYYAELYGHKQLVESLKYLEREMVHLRSAAEAAGLKDWEIFSSPPPALELPISGTHTSVSQAATPSRHSAALSPYTSRSALSSRGSTGLKSPSSRRRKPRSAAAESLLSRWEKALTEAEKRAQADGPLPSLHEESVDWVPFDSQDYASLRLSLKQRQAQEAREAKQRLQATLQRAEAAKAPFSSKLQGSGRTALGDPLTPLSKRGRPGAAAASKAELTPVLLTTKDMQPYDEALAGAEEAWKINNLDWQVDDFVQKRNKSTAFRFDRNTRAMLRSWFRFLDDDGSGEIEVTELEDPMLSTGLVANHRELTDLFNWIDTDGSGDIDVWEFMNALKPTAKWRMGDNGGSNLFGAGKGGGKGGSHFKRSDDSADEGKAAAAQSARRRPRIPTDGSVMTVEQLQAAFLPQDEANEGQSMTALLDLIAGGEQHLSIPTKLTAQRRNFLMSMIVKEQGTAVQARREIHRALTAAQAAQDHVTILRLRNLQRERDAAQLRKVERMKALRIIIDRKQREREEEDAASAASKPPSRPHSTASSVLTETPSPSRPFTASAEQMAAATAALEELQGVLTSEEDHSLGMFARIDSARSGDGQGALGGRLRADNDTVQSHPPSKGPSPRRLQMGASGERRQTVKQDTRVGAMQRIEAEAEASLKQKAEASADKDRRHASGAVGSQAAADAAWELEQALTGGSAAQRRRAAATGADSFAALAEAHAGSGRMNSTVGTTRRGDKYAVRVPIEGWVEGGKMADMARVLAGRML